MTRPRDRVWLHLLLLALTAGAATLVGAAHYASFLVEFGVRSISPTIAELLAGGLWYSVTILAILGAHEMGHYLTCRYHRISASLPYFIPAPFTLVGTFGAFIRIRQPFRSKRELFDVGVGGPLAGFLVTLPALLWGLHMSNVARVPPDMEGFELGEPLLFQWLAAAVWGAIPDGYSINLHPMAFAAWFGLLATLLNLFPIGQLDGGHISYAVLGRRSRYVTIVTVGAAVALTFVSMSWLVWTVLMVGMLLAFGPRHPPTLDDRGLLGPGRLAVAVVALAIFVLCFTPAPIQPLDLLRR